MSSNQDVFQDSGPTYLKSINWNCAHDQRVVVASLVQATYVLENDRVSQRVGPEQLAPAWWQHFNFECKEILKDQKDRSIIGCIYELIEPHSDQSAPRFVVAFRGTMPDRKHGFHDGLLDLTVAFGGLNKSTCVEIAIKAIYDLLLCSPNIWLGGHSLGASIATVAGKYMANTSIRLKTFLFNPPYVSINLDWFSKLDQRIKDRLRTYKTILKGEIVPYFMQSYQKKSREEFSKLAAWIPFLFVNPGDPISTNYIRYFEERKKTTGRLQIAHRISLRGICSDMLGGGSEMPHLLPSACLAVNQKKMDNCLESHALCQWWQHDIRLNLSDHHYDAEEECMPTSPGPL